MGWDFSSNLEDLNTAIKEWVGRLAYQLAGRCRSDQPVALRHMHDGLQEPFDRPTVKTLAVERYGFHLASGGLRVDGISKLYLPTRAGRLAAQDLEYVRRQDIATN